MKLPFQRPGEIATEPIEASVPQLDAGDLRRLSTTFSAPPWLRDLGLTSWFLIGLLGLLAGITLLLGLTATIVDPVVLATIIAAVLSPSVASIQRRGAPRALAAVIVLLCLIAVAGVILIVVLGAIVGQSDEISKQAAEATSKMQHWLTSVGVNESAASTAKSSADAGAPAIVHNLVRGVLHGLRGLSSFVFGLALTLLSTFFLLKDGPVMRRWVNRHLGLPLPVAEMMTGAVLRSLRGYFLGVTIVAAFNGVVVFLGALILGVPLAGTIGVVTFVTAYVPFIGAFVAGTFAVLLALGSSGVTTALLMLVIVLLANGLLQNLVQPFAMGSALDLHPLVVLVVSIGAGCLFGMVGLVLAAPLTSAAVHIMRDLGRARAAAQAVTATAV